MGGGRRHGDLRRQLLRKRGWIFGCLSHVRAQIIPKHFYGSRQVRRLSVEGGAGVGKPLHLYRVAYDYDVEALEHDRGGRI